MHKHKTFTREGIEDIYTYESRDFPYESLIPSHVPGTKKHHISNTFGTFDIETTSIRADEPYAYMYSWQTCVDGTVCLGRTWQEFMFHVKQIGEALDISSEKHFVIYVHNLGFEFQFIKTFFEWEDVFARSRHKILRATTTTGLEFRCSYLLSNRSLADFCREENVLHCKVNSEIYDELNGFGYDYSKIRTSKTQLDWKEIAYHINDVLGLYECIENRLKTDTLKTIPMTSTGYVRREVREACLAYPGYKKLMKDLALDLDLYYLMKEAFRGGDTHANALYVGEICHDIEGYDKASSYPYQIMAKKYPMTPFMKIRSSCFSEYYNQGYAMIFQIRFIDIEKRDEFGFPYIATHKCRNRQNIITDNGRILSAAQIELTITDIDYRIISEQYVWKKMYVNNVYISKYEYLPEPLRKETLEYFFRKTTLKNVNYEDYMKSKNKLNAIYGMMVTDIINDEWLYRNDSYEIILENLLPDTQQIENHYKSRTLFLAYQWGIWTTAHARYDLYLGRKAVGEENVMYNDTDSLKCIKGQQEIINSINAEIIRHCEELDIVPKVEYKGETYYMGVWENDSSYSEFRTWGSKKYAYVEDNEIHTTISGVSKQRGKETLEKKGGIEAFKPGLVIERCGNMTGYYNDCPTHMIEVEGVKMLSGSNLALFESDYELGVDNEYKKILPFFNFLIDNS